VTNNKTQKYINKNFKKIKTDEDGSAGAKSVRQKEKDYCGYQNI